MPSIRINFAHRHLGRVNTTISASSDALLRKAVGLTDALHEEQDVPLVSRWSDEVSVGEHRWERVKELFSDSACSIPAQSVESAPTGCRELRRSEMSSILCTWSSSDLYSDIERLLDVNSENPLSASRLSSDSSSSSEHGGHVSVAEAVRLQRARPISITTGRSSKALSKTSRRSATFDSQTSLEHARTLAVLEGMLEPSTPKPTRSSSLPAEEIPHIAHTTRPSSVPEPKAERDRALARLPEAASGRGLEGSFGDVDVDTASPEYELDPFVHFERSKTLAILDGTISATPDYDYGDSPNRLLFEHFHRQEVAEAADAQKLREAHEQLRYRPKDPELYTQRIPASALHSMTDWLYAHLWNHISPEDRALLIEWDVTSKALLLEVEDACGECDTLRVARVYDLNACTEEEFVVLMEKVARRGWRDVIWVAEREYDFPMRLAPASAEERIAFEMKLGVE